ncbi:MAG: RluA family pseudouridine synthase [Oscillospiraceae bacterium]|nr:RluA family pseudouridine synthase [Oscillospiraceae bacterium]MDD7470468.1 RluA family pseudouridine synthase [Oscillospiraceae bacterium]MDY2678788.1 RluA family pseudouridine synthase [Oscillospiraceae bacterium]
MREFVIGENDANQRLDKYISKAFPLIPKSLMYKYIRSKRIKVNSKKCDIGFKLQKGDVVSLYINDEFFAPKVPKYDFMGAGKNLSVVYEDENILLADKPVGLLSHPDADEYNDTAITRIKRYLYEKHEYCPENEMSFAPALVNRIDRNTAGIIIAAKNAEALRILNEKLKNRELHKLYLCVVIGKLQKESGVLKDSLQKNEKQNKVYVSKGASVNAKSISTKYRVLGYKNGLSLIEVELLTGRTHQIRAHFAFYGHPLLGDGKYGTNAENKRFGGYKKQFLYSYKLIFDFKTDAGILNYLNKKEFEVENVWFKDAFFNGEI